MYKNAVNTDCDILVCGYFLQKKLSIKKINCDDILIDNQNINKHLPMLKNLHLIDPVWNKMYKKSFLENSGVLMPKGEIFEDTFFNLTLLKFSPKIVDAYAELGGTPWLDFRHTVFGQVINGIDVVDTIANVKVGQNDKPNNDVVIETIEISVI